MPAANRIGIVKIPHHGRLAASHVHRLGHRLGDPAQDPVDESTLVQLLLERGFVEVAAAHPAKDLEDADQGCQVDQSDEDQEDARDRGAPHARRALKS